jgi:hypothetical protein
MTLTLASCAIVAVACGKTKAPTTAMSADLKRDLQLASATQNIAINPDEVSPSAKPEAALRLKKAPQAPKVIRTEHPQLKASAKAAEVAEIKTDIPQVQVMAASPTPAQNTAPDAPPMARPAPIPVAQYPASGEGQGPYDGRGPGAGNGGTGGVWGGIFGGHGGIGDDDHCEPRPQPRGRPIGPDVFGGLGRPRSPVGPTGRAPIVPIGGRTRGR